MRLVPERPPVDWVPQFAGRPPGAAGPWDDGYHPDHEHVADGLAVAAVEERMRRWREVFDGPYPERARDRLFDALSQAA